VFVQLWDVAAVADGSGMRFGSASGVKSVDRLLGEFHGELLMFRHGWVLGDRLPDETLGSITHSPDWTGAHRRSSTLPEGAPQHQDVAITNAGILHLPPRFRVLNGKTCGEKLLTNNFPTRAFKSQPEVLDSRVCKINRVNNVPDLTESRGLLARPCESRLRAPICPSPCTVVAAWWAFVCRA